MCMESNKRENLSQKALELISNKEIILTVLKLSKSIDYKDSREMLYQCAVQAIEKDINLVAIYALELLGNYKDSRDLRGNIDSSISSYFDFHEKNEKELTIRSYKKNDEFVYIPQKYKNINITEIESEAFSSKDDIKYIVLSNRIVSIDTWAFANCRSLRDVVLSESIVDLHEAIFYRCDSLTSITIPSGVQNIGAGIFFECKNLKKIKVDERNPIFDSRDDCNAVIETATNKLVVGDLITSIPSFVASIGSHAFSMRDDLKEIEIPKNVEVIEDEAFYFCENLKSISISESVNEIAETAISFCKNLKVIHVDERNSVYDSRNNCNAIIETESNTLQIGCLDTTIPDTITSIGRMSFAGYDSLEEIVLPSSITNINQYAFAYCKSLKHIDLPDSLQSIEEAVFMGCENLTNISLPQTITEISILSFGYCRKLSEISIPKNVRNIWNNAFKCCDSLQRIEVDQDNPVYDSRDNCNAIIKTKSNELAIGFSATTIPSSVTAIGDYAFSGCESLTKLLIPSSITRIGYKAFECCVGLEKVYISSGVAHIECCAFSQCSSLEHIEVDEDNIFYDSRDNCNAVIETDTNSLIIGCFKTEIPKSVQVIAEYAFEGCSKLESIIIPDGIKEIEKDAFINCENLSHVVITNCHTIFNHPVFCGMDRLTICWNETPNLEGWDEERLKNLEHVVNNRL